MRVETIRTSDGKIRYMLVDSDSEPVLPVMRFIKFKDNSGAARNSLRSYCQHLKLFFEFIEQEGLDYRKISIDDMAAFMRWLQNPYGNLKVIPVTPVTSPRGPATVNTVISTVLNFYDYLMRHEDYSVQLSERLKKTIPGSRRGFKDFLYHVNKDKEYPAKILKVKVRRSRPKTISKEQVGKLIDACSNLRNKFLIQLLWESSIRIGEALALWLEDFEPDGQKIHIRDRGELPNLAEIKTICSPRTVDVSPDLINLFFDYVAEFHTDEVDTNHVFIKLSGENRYQPMEYQDVASLFRRLKAKTGIGVSPHILRHSSLTELRRAGWKPEHLRKRAGHAHVQTTTQIYLHPSDEDMRKDWEKAEEKMRLKRQQKEGSEQ
ncbi:site-specific recombinase [Pelotomaculum thermopropionicum SI]|uniref:Integrase n=1 Tax=Pelotomaculum thermopropionicum (strain DSM 13744 / JCM 10971 / SI) TaxID=370438 RepID=A5CYV7_PELTS|nr:integrase [Pelotomaculum thermopropionicum SI]BAF60476.1 integrase [Pelotomaculum thermopropionicum SI]BAF60839.1 site-specific recombinase [Pelotomaculum thermopropionicum SI]